MVSLPSGKCWFSKQIILFIFKLYRNSVAIVLATMSSVALGQEWIDSSTLEDTESMWTTQPPELADIKQSMAKQQCPCLPRNLCPHEFGTYSKV